MISPDSLNIDWLSFLDNPEKFKFCRLTILIEDAETIAEQIITILNKIVDNTGLQISFGKTTQMINQKQVPEHLITKYGKIKKTAIFLLHIFRRNDPT